MTRKNFTTYIRETLEKTFFIFPARRDCKTRLDKVLIYLHKKGLITQDKVIPAMHEIRKYCYTMGIWINGFTLYGMSFERPEIVRPNTIEDEIQLSIKCKDWFVSSKKGKIPTEEILSVIALDVAKNQAMPVRQIDTVFFLFSGISLFDKMGDLKPSIDGYSIKQGG